MDHAGQVGALRPLQTYITFLLYYLLSYYISYIISYYIIKIILLNPILLLKPAF